VVADVVYAENAGKPLRLDLYLPTPRPAGKLPAIVVIRGGGWRIGDKNGFSKIARHLASQGFAAACIEYRTLPDHRFPTFVHDTKAAVRWVRANAVKYSLDPNHIGAIGGSAGGHLVSLLGTSHKVRELEGTGGNPSQSSRVQAVVAMAPVVDLLVLPWGDRSESFFQPDLPQQTRMQLASPITHVDKDSAPILLLHGTSDATVPLSQSEAMAKRYRAAGLSVESYWFEGAPHPFWNQEKYFAETMQRSVAFFRKTLVP
jgi:pectinesterase